MFPNDPLVIRQAILPGRDNDGLLGFCLWCPTRNLFLAVAYLN